MNKTFVHYGGDRVYCFLGANIAAMPVILGKEPKHKGPRKTVFRDRQSVHHLVSTPTRPWLLLKQEEIQSQTCN